MDTGFALDTDMDLGSLYSKHIWIQVPCTYTYIDKVHCTLHMYGYRFLVFYTYMHTGSLYSIHIWIQVPCTLYICGTGSLYSIHIWIQVSSTLYIYGYRFLVLCTYMDTGFLVLYTCMDAGFLVLYTYMDTGSLHSIHIWIQVLNLNLHKYTLGASHAPPKL